MGITKDNVSHYFLRSGVTKPTNNPSSNQRRTTSEIKGSKAASAPKLRNCRDLAAFQQRYSVGRILGRGGFGTVYAGVRQSDNLSVAIKHVPRWNVSEWSKIGKDKVSMEVKLLSLLQNVPGVINLIDYYIWNITMLYTMEHPIDSIDLFNYITQNKFLPETSSRFIMRQVVQTIELCHAKGVFHRDIKDSNLLIDKRTGEVKLIDFGSAIFLHEEEYTVSDFNGTRVHSPPELILTSKYTANPFTVWSIGILLFTMVQGDYPFVSDKQICVAKPNYRRKISDECRHLIESCLKLNPSDRIKLEDMKCHTWLAQGEAKFCSNQQ